MRRPSILAMFLLCAVLINVLTGCVRLRRSVPYAVGVRSCGQMMLWHIPTPEDPSGWQAGRPYDTMHSINRLVLSVEYFCKVERRYPTALDELRGFAGGRDFRREVCILDEDDLKDEWGRLLAYRFDEQSPRIMSAGPDGEFGTDDDVLNAVSGNKVMTVTFEEVCVPRQGR